MPDSFPSPARRLTCAICGRAEDCTSDDVLRLSREGWPRCCGGAMLLLDAPAPAAPASVSGREKRLGRRRPARSGARVQFRRGALGLGPDLAVGLLDVSEDGARVRLKGAVDPGSEAEVLLARPGGGKPIKGMCEVRWCRPDGDGFLAGLRLRRRLSHADLLDLARAPD